MGFLVNHELLSEGENEYSVVVFCKLQVIQCCVGAFTRLTAH
jgi:hypothetical protein